MALGAKGGDLHHRKCGSPFVLQRCSQSTPQIPFDSSQKAWAQIPIQLPKPYFSIAKLAMKIVEYLALFVVEHNIQRAPLHLVHAILKSMVNLDQLVIVIMAIANHQGLGTPSLQILKSNSKLTQSALWEVKLFTSLLFYN